MSAEDLHGKSQTEIEARPDLVQVYRQRVLVPINALLQTSQGLDLVKGWNPPEKRVDNLSVRGSLNSTEFELHLEIFRPTSPDHFPSKSLNLKMGTRHSEERRGVLNLRKKVEIDPEGKISLSFYHDPAKQIEVESPDKLSVSIKVSDHMPEGNRLPYEVDYGYWSDRGAFLDLTSTNLPSFEVSYENKDRLSSLLLRPKMFNLVGNLGGHYYIPEGLTQEALETFLKDKTTKAIEAVQESIPFLAPQFPLTFDAESFVETTLGELEKELATLNYDLKAHFPARK